MPYNNRITIEERSSEVLSYGIVFTVFDYVEIITFNNYFCMLYVFFKLYIINIIRLFCLQGVKSLIDDFVNRNQPLLFYNVKPSVISIFQGVRPTEFNSCNTEQQLHEMLKGMMCFQM